jgi:hypothetical protein
MKSFFLSALIVVILTAKSSERKSSSPAWRTLRIQSMKEDNIPTQLIVSKEYSRLEVFWREVITDRRDT